MKIGKNSIIEELAKDRVIETIITNITQTEDDTLNDLAQILYEDLLLKDEEKIVQLYKDNQLQYFITRMVLNSINSKTSRYYYLFGRHKYEELTDEKQIGQY